VKKAFIRKQVAKINEATLNFLLLHHIVTQSRPQMVAVTMLFVLPGYQNHKRKNPPYKFLSLGYFPITTQNSNTRGRENISKSPKADLNNWKICIY
jgi:hypothetical protein